MSRYSNDTDALRQMVSQSLPQLFSSVISVVGVFTMMLVLSWQLTLVVLLMLGFMMFVVKKVAGGSARYFISQQKELGTVNGYIEELIEGQKVVKVFCHEPQAKEGFRTRADDLRVAAKNANTYANILFPIMGNLSHVHYALTAVVGAVLTITGSLDIGTIGSFLLYTRSFSQPITQISQQFNAVLTALAGAERIFDLIDAVPETDEGDITLVNAVLHEDGSITESKERTEHWAWKIPMNGEATYIELRGDVRFEHVTFGYEPDKPVLKDLNFYAKPGQKIALVGSTGAGKTTITNLVNRFYDVQDGRILYDMIPVNRIKKADLRRSLGMVLQDTHLFTESVRENIRYGKLDTSDTDVGAAAKLANADFFVLHLPQGYDTVLTADGANLSQGQRQLLAIARAAVADPPVLILDEATSSIDTRTEAHIEKGMDSLMQGRTVFVIAHRLSTVRNADLILVIEHGEIIERGSHEELLAQRGRYYQLYTGAFELA
jgi:ATP-binding cassette subfamily B protein